MAEIFRYWEANIAGAPLFPQGVRMLVGAFGTLFGAPPPPSNPAPPHRTAAAVSLAFQLASYPNSALHSYV